MEQRFFRLPFVFDVAKLEIDLLQCFQTEWPLHYHREDFSGRWESIALRSASGKVNDVFSHPSDKYQDTSLLALCPYFREVLSCFECNTEVVRLMQLAPGAVIHEHRDMGGGYADGLLRIHIPVRTHDDVSFVVDGVKLPMKAGECWYADFGLPHSVANNSSVDRIHLVIDGVRNAWTDRLFESCGYDLEAERKMKRGSAAKQRQVIEALLLQDTETSRALAAEMQRQLDASENNP